MSAAEHSEDLLLQRLAQQGNSGSGGPSTSAAAAAAGGADDPTALVRATDIENLLRQTVWNQNRLAVPALLVPPGELLRRGLLHPSYRLQFTSGGSLASEPLLFLPVADIPTLKRRRRLIMGPTPLPALAAAPKQLPALPAAAAAAVEAAAAAAVASGVAAVPPVHASAVPVETTAGTALASTLDSMEVDAPSGSDGAQQGSSSLLQPETQDGADGGSSAAAMQSQEGDAVAAAEGAAGEDSGQQLQQDEQPSGLASEAAEQQREASGSEQQETPQEAQQASGSRQLQALQQAQQQAQQQARDATAEVAPVGLAEDDGEEMVEGLLLVSARTALWGRFPLNGTYYQVLAAIVHKLRQSCHVLLRFGLLPFGRPRCSPPQSAPPACRSTRCLLTMPPARSPSRSAALLHFLTCAPSSQGSCCMQTAVGGGQHSHRCWYAVRRCENSLSSPLRPLFTAAATLAAGPLQAQLRALWPQVCPLGWVLRWPLRSACVCGHPMPSCTLPAFPAAV